MYFDESYNIFLKIFSKFSVFLKINAKNYNFHGFYHENRLVGNLNYYIRNQRVEICKYEENLRYCNKGRSVRFFPLCLKKTVQFTAMFHVINFFIEFFENY